MLACAIQLGQRYIRMRATLAGLQSRGGNALRPLLDPDVLDALLLDIPPLSLATPAAASDTPQCALIWNSAGKLPCASGVLIGANTVVSAAHVQFDLQPDSLALDVASRPIEGPGPYSVTAWRIGPPGDPWAVVLFRLALSAPAFVPPIQIAAAAEFEALRQRGETVRLFGFGFGRTAAGAVQPLGVKRWIDLPILPDTPELAAQVPNYDPARMFVVGALGTAAPYAIACSGDSGGPAIATIGGVPKLVGIVQRAADGLGGTSGADCGFSCMTALSRTDALSACP